MGRNKNRVKKVDPKSPAASTKEENIEAKNSPEANQVEIPLQVSVDKNLIQNTTKIEEIPVKKAEIHQNVLVVESKSGKPQSEPELQNQTPSVLPTPENLPESPAKTPEKKKREAPPNLPISSYEAEVALKLPSLIATLNNGSTESNIGAKDIFIHSVCHTCKGWGLGADNSPEPLLRCGRCRMVSYCSKEHQLQDWEAHKELCCFIKKTLKEKSKKFLYEGSTKYALKTESSKWMKIRQRYVTTVEDNMKRKLKNYEKQIFEFPPMCFTCADQSLSQLTPCPTCHAVSFCPDHLKSAQSHQNCQELKLWLDMVRFQHKRGSVKPRFNSRKTRSPTEPPEDGIYPFLSTLLGKTPQPILAAGISEVASGPLTIFWALKNQEWLPKEEILIHCIGAESEFEGESPTKWETFLLHLLPSQVLRLNIVLIGPKLAVKKDAQSKLEVCNFCKGKKCEVNITEIPGALYHDYIQQQLTAQNFSPPDIICAFDCGIGRKDGGVNGEDSWGPTIPMLRKGGIVVTTAQTEEEARAEYNRIIIECPNLTPRVNHESNPYQSLKPVRFFGVGVATLKYKHKYINIFK